MKTTEIIISGKVQGVGYRNYAKITADKLKIYGTVRNLSNGDVKVIAQTDDVKLKQFINILKTPQHSFMKIKSATTKEIDIDKEYDSFSIVY
ncbi:acylphosphatase [Aerococcaceae bacterium WGS1372]